VCEDVRVHLPMLLLGVGLLFEFLVAFLPLLLREIGFPVECPRVSYVACLQGIRY
jgi:hypothetical protein